MSKSIAIVQSNYIPWRGYFDLVRAVDEFVILDTVQFTKNDWRNRNRIRTPVGERWLTIPIRTADRRHQKIEEAGIADERWAARHWRTIAQSYAHAPRFKCYEAELSAAYEAASREPALSRVNWLFFDLVCRWLEIGTKITSAADYPDHPDPTERLIGICRAAGADRYVSGPKARAYLDPARLLEAGIELRYFEYASIPTLSVIDCLLTGSAS